ncbi:iron-sulfur protein [Acrocarpospora phusangensis]|uniref:Cytochrome bc1 complex Rieske iron-sulfur subunit n=1 Tax=Acrocarpospora phusangensis TaxID=1070424 RepID=A0A919UMH4_9ACTN|nr:Rieske (2Fe-2S) protein [Acrocarpospora phusangensis]GIH23342.1 iron-sulfur protein [Acrocarpospora phusangensis]
MEEPGTSRRRFIFRGLAGGITAALTSAVALVRPADADTEAAQGAFLAKTKNIPLRGGKIVKVKSTRYVVTQPSKGVYRCFTAKCTHQGCTVASVSGRTINCPCHGSKFSISDGRAVQGPATKALTKKRITVKKGSIRLA